MNGYTVTAELATALEIALDRLKEEHPLCDWEDYAWFRYGTAALRRYQGERNQ